MSVANRKQEALTDRTEPRGAAASAHSGHGRVTDGRVRGHQIQPVLAGCLHV